jgi:GntR family transcriptional regulator/MocR family aminotransferase
MHEALHELKRHHVKGHAGRISLLLDRSRPKTLTIQIVDQIKKSILEGRIASGVRLPSSRRLADQLDVSRNTIVRAYEILEDQTFVETRPASGVYAVAPSERATTTPRLVQASLSVNLNAMPTVAAHQAPRLLNARSARLTYDFFPGRPDASLFPLKSWRRLAQVTLSSGFPAGVSQYPDPAGQFALRNAIADHLATWRGIVVEPERIIVTTGIQEGLSLLAATMLAPATSAALETPCYQGAAFAFKAAGAELKFTPVDEDGLVADRLPHGEVSLVYVTPSHQYPTGAILSQERRRQLIAWARKHGCYIVEDDYDCDFQYEGSALHAIAAMAPDCTIYLGTFSKSLGPGLRLGYLIAPPTLVDALSAAKTLLNGGNGWLDQSILAQFINSGSYASHLLRTRARYHERRDVLIEALRRHFGDVDIGGREAGLHVCWQLPQGVPNAAKFEAMALKARVGIYAFASANAFDANDTQLGQRGIVLGYAMLSTKQIDAGIAKLSDLVDDTLDTSPEFLGELMLHEPVARTRFGKPAPRNRRKPALHAAPPHKASSRPDSLVNHTMQIVRGIYRYPVKGLSAQPVSGIELEAGKPFPFDRVFALARPRVPIDEYDPKWAKKGLFVMLMLDEGLAKVRTEIDPESLIMKAWRGSEEVFCADLNAAEGRAEVECFFRGLVPALGGEPKLVRSRSGHFMDKPDNVISLINLATVRSLEDKWGRGLDPLRFRANFYVDGLRPWQEFEWIGSDIRLGDVIFRVDRRNGRCGATNVNPKNGERDMDIPGSLRAAFGHKDLGVYLTTKTSGKVALGDPLAVPETSLSNVEVRFPQPQAVPSIHRFICRGCYFIYDEAQGHPPDGIKAGTSFTAIPQDWRCADCGTDKTAFRPYVPT